MLLSKRDIAMQTVQCEALPWMRVLRRVWELRRLRRVRLMRAVWAVSSKVWAPVRSPMRTSLRASLRRMRRVWLVRPVLQHILSQAVQAEAAMLRSAMPAAAAVPFQHHVRDAAQEVQTVPVH